MHQRQDGFFILHEFGRGQGIDAARAGNVDGKRLFDFAAAYHYDMYLFARRHILVILWVAKRAVLYRLYNMLSAIMVM